jgi:hypothetical protein
MTNDKLTDEMNDCPKDAPIGQTAEGTPDDSSRPLDVDEGTVDAFRKELSEDPREKLQKEVKQG